MTHLHPKLNWETFQKERARRKRRRWLIWFTVASTLACLSGLLYYQSQLSVPPQHPQVAVNLLDTLATPALDSAPAAEPVAEPVANEPATPLQEEVRAAEAPAQVAQPETSSPRPESLFPTAQEAVAEPAVALANQEDNLPSVPTPERPVLPASQNALPLDKLSLLQTPPLPTLSLPLDLHPAVTPVPLPQSPPPAAPEKLSPVPSTLWLAVAWSPWHSREFRIPTSFPPENELQYRALNSFNLALRLEVARFNQWVVAIEPQYNDQRFQLQFSGQYAASIYAPGSLIGYLQTVKGFEPIIADTVRGITTRTQYENGSQREFSLPVSVSRPLLVRGPYSLLAGGALGVHYRAAYRGSWVVEDRPVSLAATPAQWGLLAAGNLSVVFQPGRIRYACTLGSAYRSTVRADQLPLRNQVWVSVQLPLR